MTQHGSNEDFGEFRCLKHSLAVHHDIFISYRVASEHVIANKLALLLDNTKRANGTKVRTFLDANCLLDGGDWEKNFLSALHHSKLILLLLSEKGLDLPSSSAQGLTKIQNAHMEQDNCLLEYEYAMTLHETNRARVFVLAVGKEGKIDEKNCKMRFPASAQAITNRLRMYEERGTHAHRDKTVGPPIHETMSKLLGFITKSTKHEPRYLHLDPDDIGCRIPDILHILNEVESKQSMKEKLRQFYTDLAYKGTQLVGALFGILLPLISIMFTLPEGGDPRMYAFQHGVRLGHVFDFLAVTIGLAYLAGTTVPTECKDYSDCLTDDLTALDWYGTYSDSDCPQCLQVCPGLPVADCNYDVANFDYDQADNCTDCFCNDFYYYCQDKQSDYQGYLFLVIMAVAATAFMLVYAMYTFRKAQNKKK